MYTKFWASCRKSRPFHRRSLHLLVTCVKMVSQDTALRKSQRSHWWLKTKLRATRRPRRLCSCWRSLKPGMTSRRYFIYFFNISGTCPGYIMSCILIWKFPPQVYASQRMRAGKGKMRNRRRIQRRGPCIIYNQDAGVTKAFRNIPGVLFCYMYLSFSSTTIHYLTMVLLLWLSSVITYLKRLQ